MWVLPLWAQPWQFDAKWLFITTSLLSAMWYLTQGNLPFSVRGSAITPVCVWCSRSVMANNFSVKVFEILSGRFFWRQFSVFQALAWALSVMIVRDFYLFVCFVFPFFETITKKYKLGLLSCRLICHRVRRDPLQSRKELDSNAVQQAIAPTGSVYFMLLIT